MSGKKMGGDKEKRARMSRLNPRGKKTGGRKRKTRFKRAPVWKIKEAQEAFKSKHGR